MAYWLLKTEPDCYAWSDLERDRRTTWDGVGNALALKNIRAMKKGDLALFYHTGTQRAAVGVVEILSDPHPDPKQDDPKLAVVKVGLKKKLARAIELSEFRADPAFEGWDLLRISRLSVVAVPPAMWKRIQVLAK
ncbi:MAG: EVE domain-containing protein [Phycisphaerales bacterium]|jgi:predicted RNA-binding protein with PUA-like domain|nr:EVE domain-containing protein [Phycisphaerales bacterium]